MRALILSLVLVPAAALAQDATVTPGNMLSAPPDAWLGDTPHIVFMGTLGGRAVDIQFPDIAAATGIDSFEGKREYLPGDGGAWRYGDFEVALSAVIDGVEKSFEIEIENFDFRQATLPATFTLGAENFPQGAAAFAEISAEWEADGTSVNDEIGAWTGTLTLTTDTGTPDAEGLVPDGMIGGFLVAQNGADAVVVSFTVPVVEYEKDE